MFVFAYTLVKPSGCEFLHLIMDGPLVTREGFPDHRDVVEMMSLLSWREIPKNP